MMNILNFVVTVMVTQLLLTPTTLVAAAKGQDGMRPGYAKGNDRASNTRRMIVHARATLVNLPIDEITPDQALFFETSFKTVFNAIQASENVEGEGLGLKSVIMEDAMKGGDGGRRPGSRNRGLRGGDMSSEIDQGDQRDRSLYFTSGVYFDILALLEVTCTFCDPDDDDDRRELSVNSDDVLHHLFETSLLDELRAGPYVDFAGLEGVSIVYVRA